jgi:hypothetical protein
MEGRAVDFSGKPFSGQCAALTASGQPHGDFGLHTVMARPIEEGQKERWR